LPQKILGQSYEKLRIRSDLGTSEENLMLNLCKTFDQCSIRSFGSANYPLHLQIFPATLLRKLPVTTSAHPHFTPIDHCFRLWWISVSQRSYHFHFCCYPWMGVRIVLATDPVPLLGNWLVDSYC